jgi:RNA polymerase sigma-70 factor (ECF subfamily)
VASGQSIHVMQDVSLPAACASPRDASGARFDALARDHVEVLWRALKRLGVPEASADDAVQQVLLVALRRLDEIEPGRERPYLLGVAVKVAADVRRARRRRHEVPMDAARDLEPAEALAEEALDQRRALADLAAALDAMPDENREAFVLFEIEELSAPQVSAVLGIPVGTVASRVRRARELVRQRLRERRGAP